MTSTALKFALNLLAAIVLFVVLRALLGLVPVLSEPILSGWSAGEFLALFIALYLMAVARRRLAFFRI
jgi:hypothetical protein